MLSKRDFCTLIKRIKSGFLDFFKQKKNLQKKYLLDYIYKWGLKFESHSSCEFFGEKNPERSPGKCLTANASANLMWQQSCAEIVATVDRPFASISPLGNASQITFLQIFVYEPSVISGSSMTWSWVLVVCIVDEEARSISLVVGWQGMSRTYQSSPSFSFFVFCSVQ